MLGNKLVTNVPNLYIFHCLIICKDTQILIFAVFALHLAIRNNNIIQAAVSVPIGLYSFRFSLFFGYINKRQNHFPGN